MLRRPSLLFGKALYLFEAGNNALFAWRAAGGLFCFDLNTELTSRGYGVPDRILGGNLKLWYRRLSGRAVRLAKTVRRASHRR